MQTTAQGMQAHGDSERDEEIPFPTNKNRRWVIRGERSTVRRLPQVTLLIAAEPWNANQGGHGIGSSSAATASLRLNAV